MCGPIALTVPLNRSNNWTMVGGLIQYNSGRLLSYAALGVIVGSLGLSINTFGFLQWISIITGGILIIYAWRKYLGDLFPRLSARLSMGFVLSRGMGKIMKSQSPFKLSMLGVLNGLLPCGMVSVALMNALLAGNIGGSSLAMFVFGIGTLPGMITVSYLANKISSKSRKKMTRTLPYLLTIVGVMIILRGMNLNIPYISPKAEMVQTVDQNTGETTSTAELNCCHDSKSCE
jgi:sulfite exporter TauE/SafE